MAGKTLDLTEVISEDQLATRIANQYIEWESERDNKIEMWKEVSQYVFATDTTSTRNSKLPWSNKTTIPKLCQIRDNLYANYMTTLFPKRKWLIWEGVTEEDEETARKEAIESYMQWVTDRNQFYNEISKAVTDYIDKGNMFLTAEWVDKRNIGNTRSNSSAHFSGPVVRRISPLDIVFNPTSPSFEEAPKIVRSLVSMGEVVEMLERPTLVEGEREYLENLLAYMKEIRSFSSQYDGAIQAKDDIYNITGFNSYREYLQSGIVEILTFYGDVYNEETGEFKRDQILKIVDRHKIMTQEDNPSGLGYAPIFHVGWRIQPDSLWAMGPLENLVGMQYRIDHVENLKADLFDITALPPLKVSGYVEEFEWGPMERINVGDNGDVQMMIPSANALQYNTEIAIIEAKMEEMAGAPKEALGLRSPGEKTAFEVQRLESAASRIYQNKITQVERNGMEKVLNFMLELARDNLASATIRIFDNDDQIADFLTVSGTDIGANGEIKPVAARHFAERAELVQNLTQFYGSALGADPEIRAHISSIKLARMFNDILDLDEWDLVEPYIRITEQQELQRRVNVAQEDVSMEIGTPAGVAEDDIDPEDIEALGV